MICSLEINIQIVPANMRQYILDWVQRKLHASWELIAWSSQATKPLKEATIILRIINFLLMQINWHPLQWIFKLLWAFHKILCQLGAVQLIFLFIVQLRNYFWNINCMCQCTTVAGVTNISLLLIPCFVVLNFYICVSKILRCVRSVDNIIYF